MFRSDESGGSVTCSLHSFSSEEKGPANNLEGTFYHAVSLFKACCLPFQRVLPLFSMHAASLFNPCCLSFQRVLSLFFRLAASIFLCVLPLFLRVLSLLLTHFASTLNVCWSFFTHAGLFLFCVLPLCFKGADSIFFYARCLYFVRVLPLSFKHTTFIFYACCCYFFYMNCLYFACVLYRFSFAHAAAIFVHVTHVRVLMLCMCCLSTAILTVSIFV